MIWPSEEFYGRALSAAISYSRTAKVLDELSTEPDTVEGTRAALPRLPGSNWVYVIEHAGSVSSGKVLASYSEEKAKGSDAARSLARFNGGESRFLYVGSKRRQGIGTRLKQHLSNNPGSQTYSLKLGCWYPWHCQIHLRQYDLPQGKAGSSDDLFGALVLQVIEDSIANELAPLFGKRGGSAG